MPAPRGAVKLCRVNVLDRQGVRFPGRFNHSILGYAADGRGQLDTLTGAAEDDNVDSSGDSLPDFGAGEGKPAGSIRGPEWGHPRLADRRNSLEVAPMRAGCEGTRHHITFSTSAKPIAAPPSAAAPWLYLQEVAQEVLWCLLGRKAQGQTEAPYADIDYGPAASIGEHPKVDVITIRTMGGVILSRRTPGVTSTISAGAGGEWRGRSERLSARTL